MSNYQRFIFPLIRMKNKIWKETDQNLLFATVFLINKVAAMFIVR